MKRMSTGELVMSQEEYQNDLNDAYIDGAKKMLESVAENLKNILYENLKSIDIEMEKAKQELLKAKINQEA